MSSRPSFEYRHIVSFEDTNLVGNVYYVNHLKWQGKCRELFIREHVPELLSELTDGLALATVRCSCEYFAELQPFDEIVVRMHLEQLAQTRLTLEFEYWRVGAREELVARGEQQVTCLRRHSGELQAAPVPAALVAALRPYLKGEA